MKTKEEAIESVYAPKRKKAAQRKIALASLAIAAMTIIFGVILSLCS